MINGQEGTLNTHGCFHRSHRHLRQGQLLIAELMGWRKNDGLPVVKCPCCKQLVAVQPHWKKAQHEATSGYVIDDVPDGVRTKDIHTFLLPNIPRR